MNNGNMNNKKRNRKLSAIIIGIVLATIIIVLLVLFLNGKTTTTGNYPENVSDESLTCTADNIDYPIFTYDKSNKKEAEINVLFSKDKLKSIALTYSLYYDDPQNITGSEAHNHAAMGQSFANDELEADALSATYSKFSDRMQMRLYSSNNQFESNVMKYFMVTSEKMPIDIEDFKNNYQKNGFTCRFQ